MITRRFKDAVRMLCEDRLAGPFDTAEAFRECEEVGESIADLMNYYSDEELHRFLAAYQEPDEEEGRGAKAASTGDSGQEESFPILADKLDKAWSLLSEGSKDDMRGHSLLPVRQAAKAMDMTAPGSQKKEAHPIPVSPISPAHYQTQGGAQVIDIARELDFCRGNVVKYVARAGKKDARKELEDLLKAKWYLDEAIDQVQSEQERNQYNNG